MCTTYVIASCRSWWWKVYLYHYKHVKKVSIVGYIRHLFRGRRSLSHSTKDIQPSLCSMESSCVANEKFILELNHILYVWMFLAPLVHFETEEGRRSAIDLALMMPIKCIFFSFALERERKSLLLTSRYICILFLNNRMNLQQFWKCYFAWKAVCRFRCAAQCPPPCGEKAVHEVGNAWSALVHSTASCQINQPENNYRVSTHLRPGMKCGI